MKIGDTVRFLNDIGGGKVARIEGKTAYVIDSDGFETPVLLTQCVVVPSAEPDKHAPKTVAPVQTATSPAPAKPSAPKFAPPAPQKAPGFNVSLLFEPQDIKRLSQTKFDLYLVNDTNYTLHYAVSSRDRLDSEWSLVAAGEADPCTQEFLGEVMPTDLNRFENITVQLIAIKTDAAFELMPPMGMETRFDVTRLAKLHCFTATAYSPTPVLTLPVVTNGKIIRPVDYDRLTVPAEPQAENRPQSRPADKNRKNAPEVIDLHAHELLDSTAGMQSAEILAYQLEVFDKKMKEASKKPGTTLIFIHGKGEGVLRKAILDRLRHKWPQCEAQDASFLEYGFGATQIKFRK